MIIKKIHIENFGKLHMVDMSLNDSLNTICEANGYGKTTLGNFIAVMFFGFDGERKKAIIDNQRKRYAPWQGGVYGGSITFEHNCKEYILERTFGAKDAKEDTFELYDAITMLRSDDFTENIGEELLSIDRDSFVRTAFIGQQDMKTAATSSINAKMGDLSSELADLADYEAVEASLASTITQMSPTRKTGEIHKLNDAIALLRADIQKESSKILSLDILEGQKQELIDKKNSYESEQQELQARINEISGKKDKYSELVRIQENYNSARREVEEALDKVKEDRLYFPKDIPTEELLDEMQGYNNQLVSKNSIVTNGLLEDDDAAQLAELEARFVNGVPSEDDVNRMLALTDELAKLKEQILINKPSYEDEAELEELGDRFSYAEPETIEGDIKSALNILDSREEFVASRNTATSELGSKMKTLIDAQADTLKCRRTVEEQEAEYNKSYEVREKANEVAHAGKVATILLIVGALIAVLGIVGFVLKASTIACAGIVAVGVIIAVIGGIKKGKTQPVSTVSEEAFEAIKNLLEDSRAALQTRIDNEDELKGEISDLESEFKRLEGLVKGEEDKLETFCKVFGIEARGINANVIYQLQSDLKRFKSLIAARNNYIGSGVEEAYDTKLSELSDKLRCFVRLEDDADVVALAKDLPHNISDYNRLSSQKLKNTGIEGELESTKNTLREFFEEYGFDFDESKLDYQKELAQIINARVKLFEDIDVANAKNENLKSIEASDDYAEVKKAEELKSELENVSIENLNDKFNELQDSINNLNGLIGDKAIQIGDVQDELDKIEDSKEECDKLVAKQESLTHRMHILKKTSEILSEAKNAMTTRYMSPFRNAFNKYYEMIENSGDKEYLIDANLNVAFKAYGRNREIDFLSSGYQDLVNLCSRMAMLDCMYEQDKPMIIMDDPFVNLDDDKYRRAMSFLEEASKDYQILYFSCRG